MACDLTLSNEVVIKKYVTGNTEVHWNAKCGGTFPAEQGKTGGVFMAAHDGCCYNIHWTLKSKPDTEEEIVMDDQCNNFVMLQGTGGLYFNVFTHTPLASPGDPPIAYRMTCTILAATCESPGATLWQSIDNFTF